MLTNKKIYFFILLNFILIVSLQSADAQSQAQEDILPPITDAPPSGAPDVMPAPDYLPDVKMLPKTHPEKIIFSQYKLAGATPDFDEFARNSPFYIDAQNIDKSAMQLSEYNRLSNNYNLHEEDQAIVVHTLLQTDEYSRMQNQMNFSELDKDTFFRFKFYGQYIGIVPEDIDKYSQIQIDKEVPSTVTAEFILKPTFADRSEPLKLNTVDYWLMFARIGEVRIWDGNNQGADLVWYHKADWYNPMEDSSINNLYSN